MNKCTLSPQDVLWKETVNVGVIDHSVLPTTFPPSFGSGGAWIMQNVSLKSYQLLDLPYAKGFIDITDFHPFH